jgi:hypothetical protein
MAGAADMRLIPLIDGVGELIEYQSFGREQKP